MPKKRNNAWSLRKKQKQIITARLIEISLKVDEYVYNHKPISTTEAEQLIKEVESYKTTCIHDERSLQVIEKLTRCMKAIILEQEQSDNDYMYDGDICNLGDNRPASVSPVYSMCDEDLTQFSQTIDATGANEGDKIINLCFDDDDNSTNTGTEDFIRLNQIHVEVDIHRAVSNLSIQEVPIAEEETCSQSILTNFDDQMQPKPTNTPAKTILNSSIGNDDRKGKATNGTNHLPDIASNKIIKVPALIIRPSKMFKPATRKKLGDTILKLQEDSRILKPVHYNTFNVNDTKQANMYYPVSNKVMNYQERTVQGANKSTVEKLKENYSQSILSQNYAVEVTNLTNTNEDHFKPNFCGLNNSESTNKTNKILDKDKQINNTIISSIPENTTETKKKRAPRKKKNVETKENKTKKSPVKKKSTQKTKPPTSEPPKNSFDLENINPKIPIYNDRVINDLSWMENIRFVREIRPDENDQTLNLEESFWDNYHLPASWNDNEFL